MKMCASAQPEGDENILSDKDLGYLYHYLEAKCRISLCKILLAMPVRRQFVSFAKMTADKPDCFWNDETHSSCYFSLHISVRNQKFE